MARLFMSFSHKDKDMFPSMTVGEKSGHSCVGYSFSIDVLKYIIYQSIL